VPAPENTRKKIWGTWSIAPVKKINFQLQNNAPYAQ
jgi:hypothetical protein